MPNLSVGAAIHSLTVGDLAGAAEPPTALHSCYIAARTPTNNALAITQSQRPDSRRQDGADLFLVIWCQQAQELPCWVAVYPSHVPQSKRHRDIAPSALLRMGPGLANEVHKFCSFSLLRAGEHAVTDQRSIGRRGPFWHSVAKSDAQTHSTSARRQRSSRDTRLGGCLESMR